MSFCLFFYAHGQVTNVYWFSVLTFKNPKDIFSCFIRILFLRCDILNKKPMFNYVELAFFFLSRKAGVSSRLLPLWTCHFFFFFPIYFFLELVKEWVSNNKKIFFSLADPYILMVVLMFPKNRNFEHFKNLSGHIKGTRMKINV